MPCVTSNNSLIMMKTKNIINEIFEDLFNIIFSFNINIAIKKLLVNTNNTKCKYAITIGLNPNAQ